MSEMSDGPRTFADHVTTWAVVVIVGLYGLISLAGVLSTLSPQPEGSIRHGVGPGVMIFQTIAALYGAAAILQLEYGVLKWWRPGWRQGLNLVWFGGWTMLVGLGLVHQFFVGGSPAVGEFIGAAAVVLGLFVVLPWTIATLRHLFRQERYEGFIRD